MELPKLEKPDKYVGLYVFDFGDRAGVGFTAREVAELLESERYSHGRVYKIHKAYPDGRLDLKGIPNQTFQLEAGLFFYCHDLQSARTDFERLIGVAADSAPPCRAKVHLAQYAPDRYVVALIYPAEYDQEIGSWLLAADYKTAGPAEGGTAAVQRYYDARPKVLERHQLFAKPDFQSRTGQQLLASVKLAVQR